MERRRTLLGISVLPALLLAGCAEHQTPEAAMLAVTAGVAQQIHPDAPERYSASIEPYAQVDLAFNSSGVVEEVLQVRGADGRVRNVEPGDHVGKDAELARVRPIDYQHRVEQADAQAALAEAQLAQARAQRAQVQANLDEAETEFKRTSNLFQSASVVKAQFDQAKGRYDALTASVEAAEASVKAAEAGVANTRAAAGEARLSLSDTSLRAPFAGWIVTRNVDRGSIVSGATIGFRLIDTHLVKAAFAVPDSALPLIRLGQPQRVTLDVLQHDVAGVITSISPQADPRSRVFSVEVTLNNPHEDVRPGMIGSLAISGVRSSKARLVVPLGAVVRGTGSPNGFAVFRLAERDGKNYAQAQQIEIGQTFGNSIEVTRGLREGDRIIALGGSLVHDGQQVRVIP